MADGEALTQLAILERVADPQLQVIPQARISRRQTV
jgi:hypothetical protein